MTDIDRVVAGISCREVLADLCDFLDGALGEGRVATLRAHLGGCDVCARFGADVSGALQALRDTRPVADVPAGFRERIREAIARG